jgi:O-antigen/teichoic acid export membrane protein
MKDITMLQSERFWRLCREGLWVTLGQIAAVAGGLAGVRLLTELMEPAAYGELALGMTVATLMNQVVLGPLGNGATRFYAPADEAGDLPGYLTAVRRMVLSATTGIILAGLLLVVGLVIAKHTIWLGLAASALVFALLSGHNSILNGIQNAARQRSIVALHQGMESWTRFLAAAGLMVLMGATSTVAMVGYGMGVILVLGSQCLFFRKIVPKNVTESHDGRNWSEQIWKYSWPFASWGIFTWAQQASGRWALGILTTTQEVGLFAVLFQLGYYPMSMATGMAMQFFAPIFYQRAGDASDSRRNADVTNLSWRLTNLALAGTCAAFLMTFLFHTRIFRVFVAKEYASVSHLLPWMMLAGGVFAAGQTISLNLMSQMKTRTMAVAKIVTAFLGVILNFAGAYWYGTAGIVIAGVMFSVLYFLWMILLSKKPGENLALAETNLLN